MFFKCPGVSRTCFVFGTCVALAPNQIAKFFPIVLKVKECRAVSCALCRHQLGASWTSPTIRPRNTIKLVNSRKVTQGNEECSFRFRKWESIAFVSTVCQMNLRSECKTSSGAHVDADFSTPRSVTYFRLELVECDSSLIWLFIWYFQRKASLHAKFNEAFYWKVLANPG